MPAITIIPISSADEDERVIPFLRYVRVRVRYCRDRTTRVKGSSYFFSPFLSFRFVSCWFHVRVMLGDSLKCCKRMRRFYPLFQEVSSETRPVICILDSVSPVARRTNITYRWSLSLHIFMNPIKNNNKNRHWKLQTNIWSYCSSRPQTCRKGSPPSLL